MHRTFQSVTTRRPRFHLAGPESLNLRLVGLLTTIAMLAVPVADACASN